MHRVLTITVRFKQRLGFLLMFAAALFKYSVGKVWETAAAVVEAIALETRNG